jgi:hypothetical protein
MIWGGLGASDMLQFPFKLPRPRHCERSEAIQESAAGLRALDRRVAPLLAMTMRGDLAASLRF